MIKIKSSQLIEELEKEDNPYNFYNKKKEILSLLRLKARIIDETGGKIKKFKKVRKDA